MPKRSLRQQMLAARHSLKPEEWCLSSMQADKKLIELDEFINAESIALYAAVNNEIDTYELALVAMQADKALFFPLVRSLEIVLRQVKSVSELQKGSFGIPEPSAAGRDYYADDVDLIIVPGVAFDLSGHRIGYGKGFYDRFLGRSGQNAFFIGLCHDFQIVETALPADPHDVMVDMIVSNKRIIRCGSNRSHLFGTDKKTG